MRSYKISIKIMKTKHSCV